MLKTAKGVYPLLLRLYLALGLLLTSCKPALVSEATVLDSAKNSEVLSNIKKTGVLRVGTTGDFVPFSYHETSDTTQYSGIDIELAKDLAQDLSVKLQLIRTTWPNLIADMEASKFDIGMSGITITDKRKETAYFSVPSLKSGKAAITRDEAVSRFTTLSDINKKGVRVIVNPGGTNESFARKNFPLATIVQNNDNISIFKKIVAGEADLMVTDAIETLVQERINPELEAVNPHEPFNSFEMGYLMPKDSIFKTYIDEWLLEKLSDGTYRNITAEALEKFN